MGSPSTLVPGAVASSGGSPAGQIQAWEAEDSLSRLDVQGQGFSVSIDHFRVVAGSGGSGAEISFRAVSWLGLDSVIVLRNLSRDQGSASALQTFMAVVLKAGCVQTFSDQDAQLTTSTFYYWLKAIPQNKTLAVSWVGPVSIGPTPAPPAGTVTSVGLTMPAEFMVAGSPVTSAGTLAVTKANEGVNQFWAGPASGSAGPPVFRALVPADIQAALASGFYRLIRVFMITASGSYVPTSGTRALYVECIGGGGGGGAIPATSSNASASGGGGSGGYSASFITSVLASYPVTVGAAGGGGAACANAGTAGGATNFGSGTVIANGGGGGGAGPAAGTAAAIGNGGTGASPGTGDLAIAGNAASRSVVVSGSLAAMSCGAPCVFGGAPPPLYWVAGSGGVGGVTPTNTPGIGGYGAVAVGSFSAFAGGAGTAGIIRVWEFG